MKHFALPVLILFACKAAIAEEKPVYELVTELLAIYEKVEITENSVICMVNDEIESYILNKSLLESNDYFERNKQRFKGLVELSLNSGDINYIEYPFLGLVALYILDFSTFENLDETIILSAEELSNYLPEAPTSEEMRHLNRLMPKLVGEEYWSVSSSTFKLQLVNNLVKGVVGFLKLRKDEFGSKNIWLNSGQKSVTCRIYE